MVAGALLLSGCSPSTNSGNVAASGQPKGKTLIYGRNGDSVTLDPWNSIDNESNIVCQEVYDTLVTYKPGTNELTPDLATKWQVSSDGLKWTFDLVHNVQFQDGTPFNADAVLTNFERAWDTKNPLHKGSFATFRSDMGGFKGDPNCVIQDFKKVDDYTVEVDLTHPFSPLAAAITTAQYGIESPDALQKYNGDTKDHPVGTGAFEFVSWSANDKVVLKKNPSYRTPGLPKLDGLIFQVIKDNTARLNALKDGEIDLMEGVNPSDVQSIKSNPQLHVYDVDSNNVGYLVFNTQKAPFNNVKVRQAINMVVDKQALIDAFYSGMATPAATVLPPGSWAFNKNIQSYPLDVQKAKQLLSDAGFPDGFQTELWAMPVTRPYMPQPEKVATALQADLATIGIKAKIVTYDWATYLKKTSDGEEPMCVLGWSGGTWDPRTYLYILFDGVNATPGGYNISFYKNPEVDKLLDQAQQVADQTQRADLYQKAEELIHTDTPVVPLVHATSAMAAASYVTGFVPSAVMGALFTNVDISK
jgi:peptide/nickel transport system substrate-binding protein